MEKPAKHGPNRFSNYIAIHETRMHRFRSGGFVGDDTLDFYEEDGLLFFGGQIGCKGRIIIDVTKFMSYVGSAGDHDPLIQTEKYSYNVSVFGLGNVFRYDNYHADHRHHGHVDDHHKHVFDWPRNDPVSGSPFWVGASNWPTLSEVIEEASAWHGDHYSELPDPEGYPSGLRRGWRSGT